MMCICRGSRRSVFEIGNRLDLKDLSFYYLETINSASNTPVSSTKSITVAGSSTKVSSNALVASPRRIHLTSSS